MPLPYADVPLLPVRALRFYPHGALGRAPPTDHRTDDASSNYGKEIDSFSQLLRNISGTYFLFHNLKVSQLLETSGEVPSLLEVSPYSFLPSEGPAAQRDEHA